MGVAIAPGAPDGRASCLRRHNERPLDEDTHGLSRLSRTRRGPWWAAAIRWRRLQRAGAAHAGRGHGAADPNRAGAQGRIPTLKMPLLGAGPPADAGAAAGLKVNAFAAGLKHPRWIHVLPNGDVTVAEALQRRASGAPRTLFDHAMRATMPRRRRLRREPQPHHAAARCRRRQRGRAAPRPAREPRPALRMALLGDTFYVGNTDGVLVFPTPGATRIAAGPRLASFKPGGHWTRSLLVAATASASTSASAR